MLAGTELARFRELAYPGFDPVGLSHCCAPSSTQQRLVSVDF